jgi:catechol 2,3-dioxygenase-like lactoylglutathione lyase family enzyme
VKIASVTPQLRTTDLAGSIRFYTETLGFQLAFQYQDFYAGVCAGSYVVHLKLVDEPDPAIDWVRKAEHVDLYLEVDDVRSAAAELEAKDVRLTRGVHETPWRTREITLEDDQGHSLYLYENL